MESYRAELGRLATLLRHEILAARMADQAAGGALAILALECNGLAAVVALAPKQCYGMRSGDEMPAAGECY